MSFQISQDYFGQHPALTVGFALVLGLCTGSFLNVVALRSLKEQSVLWPPSHCPSCEHRLGILDNIPVISFILLQGRCRYCQQPISIQYPLVELGTGLVFSAIAWIFLVQEIRYSPGTGDLFSSIAAAFRASAATAQLPCLAEGDKLALAGGMALFASTLIAVTVTDFREKLIPHEITYPSMLAGIIFSTVVRQDLLGTMAGIGASYIIFDFLAFYGLKIYMMMHPDDEEDIEDAHDQELDESLRLTDPGEAEPIEVMGGGDAVLSAVMSAYLGWKLLVVALVIGFLAGTVMGLVLLVAEMRKAGLLRACLKHCALLGGVFALLFGGIVFLMVSMLGYQAQVDGGASLYTGVATAAAAGALGGCLLGVVKVGTRVSKPFPFGPALALGGACAMFLIPFWLPLY